MSVNAAKDYFNVYNNEEATTRKKSETEKNSVLFYQLMSTF